MSFLTTLIDMGDAVHDLASELSEWSQATFGTDAERGPLGALKHLEKEAREAQADPTDVAEYADCLILTLDAARRAGFKPLELFRAAYQKLQVNKARTWPKPTSDEPVEHVKPFDGTYPDPAEKAAVFTRESDGLSGKVGAQ